MYKDLQLLCGAITVNEYRGILIPSNLEERGEYEREEDAASCMIWVDLG